jgi:hypothetical protein
MAQCRDLLPPSPHTNHRNSWVGKQGIVGSHHQPSAQSCGGRARDCTDAQCKVLEADGGIQLGEEGGVTLRSIGITRSLLPSSCQLAFLCMSFLHVGFCLSLTPSLTVDPCAAAATAAP